MIVQTPRLNNNWQHAAINVCGVACRDSFPIRGPIPAGKMLEGSEHMGKGLYQILLIFHHLTWGTLIALSDSPCADVEDSSNPSPGS